MRRERPSEAKVVVLRNAERFIGWLLRVSSSMVSEASEIKGAGNFDGNLVMDLTSRVVEKADGTRNWIPDNSRLYWRVLIKDCIFLRASRFKISFMNKETQQWFTLLAEGSREFTELKAEMQAAVQAPTPEPQAQTPQVEKKKFTLHINERPSEVVEFEDGTTLEDVLKAKGIAREKVTSAKYINPDAGDCALDWVLDDGEEITVEALIEPAAGPGAGEQPAEEPPGS